ncbi:CLUMA_CG016895, isoform A [Clunio marinus]|uniref:CLUMA_CG016895, isoform A n=1 Tax=Clunio marinus TaxID=568069 RepID=A0A1J1ISD7_9DIPT|nr:CLUMA_CG016895, isoform A [Clunio marinus]
MVIDWLLVKTMLLCVQCLQHTKFYAVLYVFAVPVLVSIYELLFSLRALLGVDTKGASFTGSIATRMYESFLSFKH